ncbi:hypothetical protein C8Q77DRAFT_1099511 [Trametes polyzona]|nr:hypothetical protein C8Q77DRAFT_1099511 [Trametes polyzona]
MPAKKTPKCERKSTQRPDRETAKREVVRAAKRVPKQSRTVSSLSPEANDEYYHVMAIGIVLPALPTPLARRHRRQRPIKSLEQHTSPPPLSSEARSSSISPIQPPYVDPTACSDSPLHPTTNPNATHSRPSHKEDKSHTRRRDSGGHRPPSYPIYDHSELVNEHRDLNDDRRTPVHAEAATVPYEPDRSPLPLLLRYPYLCMVPPTPPAPPPHCVDACQATPSELNARQATLGNSGFTSTRPLDHQSLAAMVPGGYRQNTTVAGLDVGPYQSGCAAPGTTPQHNQTYTRDNEAARAAQLQHVSDHVWPYGRSAHDQTGYTCLDRTGPVRPLVDNIDCEQGWFCPNEGGHQLVGPSSQNATEIMRYVPVSKRAPM